MQQIFILFYFFTSDLSSSYLVHIVQKKGRKAFACDTIYTSATQASHILGITDLVKLAVFSWLWNVSFIKLDSKLTEKLMWIFIIIL